MTPYAHSWIGIDWTRPMPKALVHDATGAVVQEIDVPLTALAGLDDLGGLGDHLAAFLSNDLPTPVVCAGLPFLPATTFRTVPTTPLAGMLRLDTSDPRITLLAVPGLSQQKPVDLMQGCETAIGGFLKSNAGFDGVVCSVGRRTTWAHISAQEVVSFLTTLAPEIAMLLAHGPSLGRAVADGPLSDEDYLQAVDDTLSRPQNLGGMLARISSYALMNGTSPAVGWARLMGAVIGADLAGARPYWLGQRVMILGGTGMAPLYARALSNAGVQTETQSRDAAMLAGLQALISTF